MPDVFPTRTRCQIRDIPVSCLCPWAYRKDPARWIRTGHHRDCNWHVSRRAVLSVEPYYLPAPERVRLAAGSYDGYSAVYGTARSGT